jgi:hypothetical protein
LMVTFHASDNENIKCLNEYIGLYDEW